MMVTVDALRADLFEDEAIMARPPALGALRDEAFWFRDVVTPGPATTVASSSLFRSRLFSQLRWDFAPDGDDDAAKDPSPLLPELLSASGVHTTVIHGSPWLKHETTRIVGHTDFQTTLPGMISAAYSRRTRRSGRSTRSRARAMLRYG